MAFCSSFSRPAKLSTPSVSRRPLLPSPVLPFTHTVSKNSPRKLRCGKIVTRAQESGGGSTPDVDTIVKDLTDKWDKVENKSSIALYGVGAIAVLYVTSSIVGAVNTIPVLPKLLELVGFIYTAWFVYRYLLFKSSREELTKDVDELKSRITGQQD